MLFWPFPNSVRSECEGELSNSASLTHKHTYTHYDMHKVLSSEASCTSNSRETFGKKI